MVRGIYLLTSSMLTSNKQLGVVSNNMSNVNTQGFKGDKLVKTSEFAGVLNRAEKGSSEEMGNISLIVDAEDTKTDFAQGNFIETGRELDFSIMDSGFFEIAGQNGTVYSRNGSFVVDDEGYLSLQGAGRVQGQSGDIRVFTNNFEVDLSGTISVSGVEIDKIVVRDFENYDNVIKNADGTFSSRDGGYTRQDNCILWKTLEGSNVNMMDEMAAMMTNQRSIQSCSQFIKISDQLASKVISQVGSV